MPVVSLYIYRIKNGNSLQGTQRTDGYLPIIFSIATFSEAAHCVLISETV